MSAAAIPAGHAGAREKDECRCGSCSAASNGTPPTPSQAIDHLTAYLAALPQADDATVVRLLLKEAHAEVPQCVAGDAGAVPQQGVVLLPGPSMAQGYQPRLQNHVPGLSTAAKRLGERQSALIRPGRMAMQRIGKRQRASPNVRGCAIKEAAPLLGQGRCFTKCYQDDFLRPGRALSGRAQRFPEKKPGKTRSVKVVARGHEKKAGKSSVVNFENRG